VPRGRVRGGAGAGAGVGGAAGVAAVAVDAAGGVAAGLAGLVLAVADGVCAAGTELTLLLHPASVKAKIVIAAIARRRLEEAFMGGILTRKGTSNRRAPMRYFCVSRPRLITLMIMKFWLPVAIVTVAVAPLAAPFLAASHPMAALLIRSFFSRLCHQDPARSFMVEGSPVAVCVRCLGIYCGVALGAWLRLGRKFAARLLAAALLINLLDVASGALHWHGNLPLVRLLLGLLLGLGAGAVLFLPLGNLPARLFSRG